MAQDDDLLSAGFIDDEPKKPAQADGGGAGFDPFADVGNVDVGVPAPTSPEPQAGGSAAAAEPIMPSPTAAGSADVADEDVVPGSRKDLWKCPHCGAGNKPGRADCRSCGKSPEDAVVPAWQKKLPLIIGGGVVALLLLIFLVMGGTDLSLRPAGSVDEDLRISADTQVIESAGFSFQARSAIAGSGRVLSVLVRDGSPQSTQVFMVFGQQATDETWFGGLAASIDNTAVDLRHNGELTPRGEPNFARVHLIDPNGLLGQLQRGDYLSFTGFEGSIDGESWTIGLLRNEYVVLVQQAQTR